MNEVEINERLALFLKTSREKAGFTQAQLAKKMGISTRTLQSYENLESFPKFSKILQWISICRQNPIYALLEVTSSSFDISTGEDNLTHKIEEALYARIKTLTDKEKRGILFILLGRHGSSVYSFVQLCIAYLHCPMGDRQMITSLIINAYKNASAKGTLVCPDEIMPDMDNLESAYELGRQAYINDEDTYVNIKFTE